jgi:hypothetical protein
VKPSRRLRRNERKRARKLFWTRHERAPVLARLGRYSEISGFVAALLLPGGVALLPALAWWHRHRRVARKAARAVQLRPHRRRTA